MRRDRENIIKQIKAMHARAEPLNVSAAARRHPDLMLKVYAMKPFWGWKQALEDAGIDYADIKIELQDYTTCKLCGIQRRTLDRHLKAVHKMTPKRYLAEFPFAELASEALRARHRDNSRQEPKLLLPHWEPVWSPGYILDRLNEMHKRGLPLNPAAVMQHERRFYSCVIKCFKTWDAALCAIGVKPESVRLATRRKSWTSQSVKKELCGMLLHGEPVNYASVAKTNPSLVNAAVRIFGSYDNALRSAGMDPSAIRKCCPTVDKEQRRAQVIAAIRGRHEAGLPLNDRGVARGPHSDPPLYSRARRLFGSWGKALQLADLDYPPRMREQPAAERAAPTADIQGREVHVDKSGRVAVFLEPLPEAESPAKTRKNESRPA